MSVFPPGALSCSPPAPPSLMTTSLERFLQVSWIHLPPLEIVPRTPAFRAGLLGRDLGRGRLVQIASSPVRVSCTPRAATHRVGDHTFKLVWQLNGEAEMEQGRHTIRLYPGQMAIYRLSQPYRLHTFGGYRALMLSINLEEIPEWRRLAERCHGQVLPIDAAAHAGLAALRSQLEWDDAHLGERVEDAALELVFGSLWRCQQERLHSAPLPSERLVRARRVVLERLADATLAPSDLARALNLSMRGLYDEFRRHRMAPPATFIRELRLEQCYLALLDEVRRGHSITRIALDHGFVDSAHFTRVFRERYGVSPSELRRGRSRIGP